MERLLPLLSPFNYVSVSSIKRVDLPVHPEACLVYVPLFFTSECIKEFRTEETMSANFEENTDILKKNPKLRRNLRERRFRDYA